MAEIVNLNRVKKKKSSAEKDKTAERNRVKFGRTKSEKQRDKAAREIRERELDRHRREGE